MKNKHQLVIVLFIILLLFLAKSLCETTAAVSSHKTTASSALMKEHAENFKKIWNNYDKIQIDNPYYGLRGDDFKSLESKFGPSDLKVTITEDETYYIWIDDLKNICDGRYIAIGFHSSPNGQLYAYNKMRH